MSKIEARQAFDYVRLVEEKDTYRIALVNNDQEELNLYVVTVITPAGIETIHVLAANGDTAIGQARCILHCQEWINDNPWTEEQIVCRTKKIPFGIQGWSDRKF